MTTIAIVGAGAVGCYFGALLARAGETVTLIGRAPHVDAVRERGLLLETRTLRTAVPLRAETEAAAVADAEVVLVCVKSGDTEAAGRAVAPHLHPDAAVLSLQNGVDNAARLAPVLGRAVIPVAVYVATEMAGPGHVRHHGRGELVIGAGPASARIAAAFGAAGIPTVVSESAVDALWSKLIVNCAYNALSAVGGLPYGRMIRVAGVPEIMTEVVAECAAVARASGIRVPDDILATVLGLAEAMPEQSSSTAQDLARGRASEIDHLNGFIVRTGQELGIPTPTNRVLLTLVKLAEARAGL
ncbi:ketopantoate reductase family protein [Methylobacterium oxalidis]|uniref:2-dehydropantoate 2-reductase n=1 Tax=Methylobacterium oxalidis TaxID=944322 RepID=A0A512J6F1_9HYPH|nr:2-dehydropantoate 2-reductase [Methylobacterium oxalidis]GEP05551.1 2-dehydropantoate 2-reductase [Methylobacterium oxalidis]GJE31079.1 2-dehydropantoate 2-reductase [Methylobacterium oxalidis]GLS65556.1 2-dehydropantoate 2-reductase [Methylobacterium oxalidis]